MAFIKVKKNMIICTFLKVMKPKIYLRGKITTINWLGNSKTIKNLFPWNALISCSEMTLHKLWLIFSSQQNLFFKPWQVFPAVHVVMWFKTFFIVRQWGRLHGLTAPFWACCSRLWHLWAWSKRTSCCWMSLRFSGSAVGGWANPEFDWK